jgi:beta-lactamase regulating signal transducer with metallopeptidase domain
VIETISRLTQMVLLNAAWQVVAVLLAAAVCARLLRHSPARQTHLIWVGALLLATLVPLWSVWPANLGAPEVLLPLAIDEQPAGRAGVAPVAGTSLRPWAGGALAATYLCFVLFRVARLAWAYRRTRGIRSNARFTPLSAPLRQATDHCTAALGVAPVRILRSPRIDGPVTLGWREPVIVLPDNLFEETSSEVLRSVVGHELAHIKRRDFALNLIYELLSIPVAIHPAVAFIKRKVQASRELACDELVADTVLDAPVYARTLVDVAGALSGIRQPAYSLGISDSDILEERVGRLIGKRSAARAGKLVFITAALVLGVSAWAASLCAVRHAAGDLHGAVMDPSGAAVPQAEVMVREISTGARQTAVTNDPGQFGFRGLPAGRYRLEIRRPSFKLFRSREFVLDGRAPARVSAVLSLGIVHEQITVRGN